MSRYPHGYTLSSRGSMPEGAPIVASCVHLIRAPSFRRGFLFSRYINYVIRDEDTRNMSRSLLQDSSPRSRKKRKPMSDGKLTKTRSRLSKLHRHWCGRPTALNAAQAAELLTLCALNRLVRKYCSPTAIIKRYGISLTTLRMYQLRQHVTLKGNLGKIAAALDIQLLSSGSRPRLTATARARHS